MWQFLGKKIRELFKGKSHEEAIEALEALFYSADLGTALTGELVEEIRKLFQKKRLTSEEVLQEIKSNLLKQLEQQQFTTSPSPSIPYVMLIVGVNGNGKTTTVAKLAHLYQKQGKKVLLAAADTFRAAAIDQLQKWSEKTGACLVKGKIGSDPAAVAFDAIVAAKSRYYDLVLIDTAGRLHTKIDLMRELEKMRRVCGKAQAGAPHETLLVLDATIGQNGIEQASMFHQFTPLTGLILTKLDGSAKGGSLLAIQKKLQLPVRYIGVGETLDTLQPFKPKDFIESLFT
jgi:fused signal recognition particle receptor